VSASPIRVLVVDDETDFASALTARLSARGFDAHFVSSGEEALAALPERTIDVIILDLKMPGMGGLEVLERLKRACPDVPVFLFTAYGDCRDQAKALGADAYIVKSCNLSPLTEAVFAAVGGPAAALPLTPLPRSS